MNRRTSTSLRALLLLLLAAGPLQAQTIFACAMMDTVVHDGCCCDEHGGDELVPDSDHRPCCERSFRVTLDEDTRHGAVTGKAVDVRPDADPPQVPLESLDALFSPPPAPGHGSQHRSPAAGGAGSGTWLITGRLRI